MNLWSFLLRRVLLRALLCVALVLNGAAPVMAHAQGAGPSTRAAAAQPVEAASAMPCAAHHGAQPVAPVEHGAAHDRGGCSDCCKSSTCRCPCVQAGVSLLVVPASPVLLSLCDVTADAATGAMPAPALPHLIRPPID